MKRRLISVLAFALAVSAGAAFVLYQLIASKVRVGAAPAPPTTKVFVAAKDLELGALITEKEIRVQEYLAPPAGAIGKKEDILNRGVASPIHQDMPFLDSSLAPKGAGAGFAATIPQGMRAFAIHVNEVMGVAGFAVAGARVDILVSGTAPGVEGVGNISRTMLQNITVLSAGQNFQKDAEGKPVLVQVVNLLVTPAQAELLNLATENRIQLVLRNPTDTKVEKTPGANQNEVFTGEPFQIPKRTVANVDQVRVPVREKPVRQYIAPPEPPRKVTIEIINGGTKSQAAFQNPDTPLTPGPLHTPAQENQP
jgi:pilus assembly protein CpaB